MLLFTLLLVVPCLGVQANGPASAPAQDYHPVDDLEKEIKVGLESNFYPFSFVDEQAQVTGFSVALIKAIAARQGLRIKFEILPWNQLRAALESGRIDMTPLMYYSDSRAERVDFSVPYFKDELVLYRHERSPEISSLQELRGQRVTVQQGAVSHDYLLKQGLEASVITVENADQALVTLAEGRGDYALSPKILDYYSPLASHMRINPLAIGGDGLQRWAALAVKSGDPQLLQVINAGLAAVKGSGEFDNIYQRWLGESQERSFDSSTIIRTTLWLLLLAAILSCLVLLWIHALRRQVRRRTLELETEVAERRLAEGSLRKSEAWFQAIFDNALIGFTIIDAGGEQRLINPFLCTMLGYSQAEMRTRSVIEITHPDDRAMTQAYYADLLEGRAVRHQVDKRYLCRNGETRWGRLTISSFRESPEAPLYLIAMIEDIELQRRGESDRVQLEARLQQSQKMETIGQLTGGIAHDFNNILASILGYTGLALEKLGENPEGKLSQYLREVYRGGERARDLIAQMLAFSRQQATVPVVFWPAAMIHEVIKLLRPSLPQSITIQIDVAEEMTAISMDPVHFHQLIMNLCINARDAMQGKGEMRVCMQVINAQALICTSCGQQVDGRFLQISVQDSGQGIKPELLAQIFDPFFTTKEVGKGTGMGLSVVHGIAHEHQGHVVVEERPGGGSSFNLLFPIIKANPEAQTLTNDRMKPHHSATAMSILVAEDEPVLARYLSELLENQGYRVTACNNGREALTHLQQAPMAYDLLITDQTMPEMTGLELTQALRRTRAQLPVILCSGFSDCLDEQVALGMGVSRYFQKPVDAGELLAAIDNCLLTIDEPSQKRAISGN